MSCSISIQLTCYSTASIYCAIDIAASWFDEVEVTVKLTKAGTTSTVLEHEYNILNSFAESIAPRPKWFGREGIYDALVLEHLGPSLKSILQHPSCNGYKFSLGTIIAIADQLVCIPTCMWEYTEQYLCRYHDWNVYIRTIMSTQTWSQPIS